MRIDIITCLPKLFESWFAHSILERAIQKGLVEVHIHDLREYSVDKHARTDDYAYGGGAGMVMMIEPIDRCISSLRSQRNYDEIIYMSPDGELLDQPMANQLSLLKNLIIIAGHYKGIDQRVRDHFVTKEISIGSYVISGGEVAAVVLSDALIRLLPGVLSDETSALSDSFQDNLLAPPVYTRPADYKGLKVPDVLLSGHEKNIEEWRNDHAIERTRILRPDLYAKWQNNK